MVKLMKVGNGMRPSVQRPPLQTLATFSSQTCRKKIHKTCTSVGLKIKIEGSYGLSHVWNTRAMFQSLYSNFATVFYYSTRLMTTPVRLHGHVVGCVASWLSKLLRTLLKIVHGIRLPCTLLACENCFETPRSLSTCQCTHAKPMCFPLWLTEKLQKCSTTLSLLTFFANHLHTS